MSRACRILFDAPANHTRTQRFLVAGYTEPIVGTVYPRSTIGWHGVPIGGLATGDVCWNGDGRFGQCTIYNQVPHASPVPVAGNVPFEVQVSGHTCKLAMRDDSGEGDLSDLRYFGHYPVADLQFDLGVPLGIEIRGFGPFIPGEAADSNTPAAVFEVHLVNPSDVAVEVTVRFTPPPTPKPIAHSASFAARDWAGVVGIHPTFNARPNTDTQPVTHQVALAGEHGEAAATSKGLVGRFRVSLAPGEHLQSLWTLPLALDSQNLAAGVRPGSLVRAILDAASSEPSEAHL